MMRHKISLLLLTVLISIPAQSFAQSTATVDSVDEGEGAQCMIWAVRPGEIAYYKKLYGEKRLLDRIIQCGAQVVLAGAISYSAWWAGSSLWKYFTSKNVPVAARPPIAADVNVLAPRVVDIEGRIERVERNQEEEHFAVAGLKLVGTLMIQGVVLAAGNKVYAFALRDLLPTYVQSFETQSNHLFEFIQYSIEQMSTFQNQDKQIFDNHVLLLSIHIEKVVIPFCEKYIGFYESLVLAVPQRAHEYKLTMVPSYLTLLSNKILQEANKSLALLAVDAQNAQAVADLKQAFELMHHEIGISITRALLAVDKEA